jgi:hypothetical protein
MVRAATVAAAAWGMLAGGAALADPVSFCAPPSGTVVATPGSSLALTCQYSGGGAPAIAGGTGNVTIPAVPGSYTYGHGYGVATTTIAGSPGFGFYDDFVFTIPDAVVNSVTSTIDLGTLRISDLQVRLYSLDLNTLPTIGVPSGTLYSAWSTPFSGPGFGGIQSVLSPVQLGAGTYVLEVRGNVVGDSGGSYSGVLNLTPVPLPAPLLLLLAGLGSLGALSRRRS